MTGPRLPALAAAGAIFLSVALAGCLAPTASVPPPPPAKGQFLAHYVYVGQGDGVIFTLPDNSTVVYDCGPPADNASSNRMVQALTARGVAPGASIFALIGSHGHLDHIGGCEEVLAQYQVQHIYEIGYDGADAPDSYRRWLDEVRAEGATLHTANEVQSLEGERVLHQWDELELPEAAKSMGLRAQFVWPPSGAVPRWDDIGLHSLVVRWSFGSTDFCVQGDIEYQQEGSIAAYDRDLNCEVYLVGHHGSAGSSSAPWLAKVAPKVAIASFGPNDYGHPTSVALCRAQTAGAKVYATQRAGTLSASSDGSTVTVAPQSPETADYCAAGADFWSTYNPPTPSPAPTPTPTPAPALNLSASASPADPCRFTEVTILAHVSRAGAGVSNALVELVLHFKTTDSAKNGTTDASGDASIRYYISGASAGYTVTVDVTATEGGQTAHAQTQFTPKSC